MPAPTKNQNAAKPESDRASTFLHVRVKQPDKASWVRKAGGQKLAQWVNQVLNEAAK